MTLKKTNKEPLATENQAEPETVDNPFTTLLIASAPKLSNKSTGKVGFEIALNTEDKLRYIRLTSNDSGGLFSKEWVKLDDINTLLESLPKDQPFKSSVFKSIIKGGSANNTSFISAVLRCDEVALIIKSDKSQYLHLPHPLLAKRMELLNNLKPIESPSKK
tara:strand:+ start:10712 stop:11197 length:486 start_codon:yes stop_codon:yes gene_type:complete